MALLFDNDESNLEISSISFENEKIFVLTLLISVFRLVYSSALCINCVFLSLSNWALLSSKDTLFLSADSVYSVYNARLCSISFLFISREFLKDTSSFS